MTRHHVCTQRNVFRYTETVIRKKISAYIIAFHRPTERLSQRRYLASYVNDNNAFSLYNIGNVRVTYRTCVQPSEIDFFRDRRLGSPDLSDHGSIIIVCEHRVK